MNTYEMQARHNKAAKLADHFRRTGIGYQAAQTLLDHQWAMYSTAAGLKKPPSAETRRMVLELLKGGS
jgi:hypothetical protein